MKGIDLFCASPASTAICVSMDSNSIVRHGGRAIDRHSPHLIDRRRTKPSQPRFQPPTKPKSSHQKCRKSSAKETDLPSPPGSTRYLLESTRRKSPVQLTDLLTPPGSTRYPLDDAPFIDVSNYDRALVPLEPRRARSMKEGESSSSKSFFMKEDESTSSKSFSMKEDGSASSKFFFMKEDELATSKSFSLNEDEFAALKSFPMNEDESAASKSFSLKEDQLAALKSFPMMEDESAALKPSSTRSHDQVVVLRVSLHCKGCEGKVRKHISRMEGVRSFSIDFPSKKVTVIGDVTPLGVLASISKVKNAQFWPSSSPSPSASMAIS